MSLGNRGRPLRIRRCGGSGPAVGDVTAGAGSALAGTIGSGTTGAGRSSPSSSASAFSTTVSAEGGASRRRRRPPRRPRRLRVLAASSSDSMEDSPELSINAVAGSTTRLGSGGSAAIAGCCAVTAGSGTAGAATGLAPEVSAAGSASFRRPGRSRRCRSGLGGRGPGLTAERSSLADCGGCPNRLLHSQPKKPGFTSGLGTGTTGSGAGVVGATPRTIASSPTSRTTALAGGSYCSS